MLKLEGPSASHNLLGVSGSSLEKCSGCPGAAVIEKYTRNTRFCLICNYVSKIIPALQSRCTRFRFPPLDRSHVQERLEHVIKAEG
jgi:hypothetical protein